MSVQQAQILVTVLSLVVAVFGVLAIILLRRRLRAPTAEGPATPAKPRFWRWAYWHGYPRYASEPGEPGTFWRRYDAQLYGLVVAIGVPLVGLLVQDFTVPFTSIIVSSFEVKVTLAAAWFAMTHAYWTWELDEIRVQIKKYGLLDVEESDCQRRTMMSLYYGVIAAGIIWVVVFAIHITTYIFRDWTGNLGDLFLFLVWSWYTTPVFYGIVELAILYHTYRVGAGSIGKIYPLITIIQQALAGQLRRETRAINQ